MATQASVKPKLRGVFHELGFYAALGLGLAICLTAPAGRPRIAALVFATSVAVCFGLSALYHRPTWAPNVRAWLARLDHAVHLAQRGFQVAGWSKATRKPAVASPAPAVQ